MPSPQQYRRVQRLAALNSAQFETFFRLPFLGRLRWFLFGARMPKETPRRPTLREFAVAEKAKRMNGMDVQQHPDWPR